MAKGGAMSFEAAKAHLEQYGLADRVIVLSRSPATVAMAAQAAGTSEVEIAKTLSFLVDDAAVLIVAAGNAKVNSSSSGGSTSGEWSDRSRGRVGESRSRRVCPFAVRIDLA